jgi:hypothetical protein
MATARGVIASVIKAAELARDAIDEFGDCVIVRDVGRKCDRRHTLMAQLGGELVECVHVSRRQRHGAALRSEGACDGGAYAATGARDHGDLAAQRRILTSWAISPSLVRHTAAGR